MASQAVIQVESAEIVVANSTFVACFSAKDGGTIQAFGGVNLTVSKSTFRFGKSKGCGGAIAIGGGKANITDSNFYGCSAEGGGGALCAFNYVRYGQPTSIITFLNIFGNYFNNCSSSNTAGAIWALSSSVQTGVVLNVNECAFQVCSIWYFIPTPVLVKLWTFKDSHWHSKLFSQSISFKRSDIDWDTWLLCAGMFFRRTWRSYNSWFILSRRIHQFLRIQKLFLENSRWVVGCTLVQHGEYQFVNFYQQQCLRGRRRICLFKVSIPYHVPTWRMQVN